MKVFLATILLALLSVAVSNPIVKTYSSIDEFKAKNPGVKLIEMDAYDHQIDASRTYSLGSRQTGINSPNLFYFFDLIVHQSLQVMWW